MTLCQLCCTLAPCCRLLVVHNADCTVAHRSCLFELTEEDEQLKPGLRIVLRIHVDLKFDFSASHWLLQLKRVCTKSSPASVPGLFTALRCPRVPRRQSPADQISQCGALPQSANSMASTVLNKPYRFILVSDLDWTMVIHTLTASHKTPAGAAQCMTVANCRLTTMTNKIRLFTRSTNYGRLNLPRIACWCFRLAAH